MSTGLRQTLVSVLHDRAEDDPASRAAAEPSLIAELALWAATADGEINSAEIRQIVGLLNQVPGLTSFTADEAVRLVYGMAERYPSEDAIAARVTEIAMRIERPAARRAAFQLACWAASPDGELSEEESDFLDVLQDLFELSDDDADALRRAVINAG